MPGSFSRYGTGQESKKCILMWAFIHIYWGELTYFSSDSSVFMLAILRVKRPGNASQWRLLFSHVDGTHLIRFITTRGKQTLSPHCLSFALQPCIFRQPPT